MPSVGRLVPLILMGLGIAAVLYLLLGESLVDGLTGTERSPSVEGPAGPDGEALAAGLETRGHADARTSPAERAAAEARAAAEVRAALKPVGVHGVVMDGRGRPIARATVRLFADPPRARGRAMQPDGPALDSTVTDEQGRFVVGPSPESGYAKVRAEAAGYAPSITQVRVRGARADLILDRGGALALKVLDEKGARLAGARALHQAGSVVTTALTAADGTAHFPALPTGTGTLLVMKDGHASVRDTNVAVAPGATEDRTIILPEGGEVEGVVLEAASERPVAGAVVTVHYPKLPAPEEGSGAAAVTTDADGRFRVPLALGGRESAQIRVQHAEFAEVRVSRNALQRGELRILLKPRGPALEGVVLSETRQPVAGARVTFLGLEGEDPDAVPEVTTDDGGAFVLPQPAWGERGGRWTLIAVSPTAGIGYARATSPRDEGARVTPVEITLGGVGIVEGRVTDAAGQPLPGAAIALGPDWSATRRRPGGSRRPHQLLNIVNDGSLFNLTTISDADGGYRLEGVPALEYKLSAALGLDRTTRDETVEVASAATVQADIQLGEGQTIEGWVLGPDDKPIAGAYVNARPTQRRGGSAWWLHRASARSQSDGRFVLRGVNSEEYTVSANASGYGGVTEQRVTSQDKELRLVLVARGWIEGRIRADGRPYQGTFTVTAARAGGGSGAPSLPGRSWRGGQNHSRTFNTDDGRFELRGLAAGEYTVTAKTADGLVTVQAAVVGVAEGRGARDVDLELARGAVVRGLVRDEVTGRGMPGHWVYANPKMGPGATPAPSAYAQTDGRGRFELVGLGNATYTIRVQVGSATVYQVLELRLGEQREIELTSQAPGTVRFTVVDGSGNPVPGARPNLRTEAGNWIGVDMARLRREGLLAPGSDWRAAYDTGADGVLVRHHIPPGVLKVWVTKNGWSSSSQTPIEVVSGRTTEVRVTLVRKDG